jgi:hypothetical protein
MWTISDDVRGPSWSWSYGSWIYNYLFNQYLSTLMLWVRISIRARCTTLCDKVCQWLATGRWFFPGPPISSTNKTDRHDITKILLKVALSTIKQTKHQMWGICLIFLHSATAMTQALVSFKKIYAPSSSLLQGKHLPFSPSPLRLNIFCLFVILSLTQLYRYTPEIFLFSTATFKYIYRAPLRQIGQE